MSAAKLLDETFKAMQPKSEKPTLSESNICYLQAVKVIEIALTKEYQRGRTEAFREMEAAELAKQKKQN